MNGLVYFVDNALPAGILCLTSGYGGNAWYGIIWFLWGILWLTAFVEINPLRRT